MKKPYIFPLLLGSLVLTGCANGQIDAMQMRLNQQYAVCHQLVCGKVS